jgi:hypothetical protein
MKDRWTQMGIKHFLIYLCESVPISGDSSPD